MLRFGFSCDWDWDWDYDCNWDCHCDCDCDCDCVCDCGLCARVVILLFWFVSYYSWTNKYPQGWTALHMACAAGSLEGMELLMANGADVNLQDKGGHTPLIICCANGFSGLLLLFSMCCFFFF